MTNSKSIQFVEEKNCLIELRCVAGGLSPECTGRSSLHNKKMGLRLQCCAGAFYLHLNALIFIKLNLALQCIIKIAIRH